ncbi:MAG: dihydropteroate synthase [Nocardioidaceae bacterium]
MAVFGRPLRHLAELPAPDRCLVMGVVNVTPDSFSDGGRWLRPDDAISHGLEMLAAGADLLDVGGESTRPGAERPSVAEELDRVLPVVSALCEAGAVVSIDTMRASVARRAVDCGAAIVNDVSGGLADEAMFPLVADLGVACIVMHWRGHSASMQQRASYVDVLGEVTSELAARASAAVGAGIAHERIALDPGIGFAKLAEHNWSLLRHLDALHVLGFPLVVGSSRKAFLGRLLADPDGTPRAPVGRDDASAALSALAAICGAWCVRVHDVSRSHDAVRVAARIADEDARA